MPGYLNRPQATADAFDEEGFLRTGDIVRCDWEGYCTVTDRLKELVKYKGFQVAPAELEDLLMTHPAVADAAVVGRPCDVCLRVCVRSGLSEACQRWELALATHL